MASLYKSYGAIQNRVVTIAENKSKGWINYDTDNAFPQNLIRQISESGTATACLELLSQFVYAEGLVDADFGKTMINPKQSINDVLGEISYIYPELRGVAFHIARKLDGSIGEVKLVPFEQVRKMNTGDYCVNPTFGCGKVDEKKSQFFKAFQGAKINPLFIRPNGEILYFFIKKPMQMDYPIPPFYSAIEDVNADTELSKYELESVTNSFLAGGVLNIVGDIDDETKDDNNKTEWDYLNDSLEGFTGAKKDAKGGSGRQSLLVLHAKTKEEIAVYSPIEHEGTLNAAENATKRVSKKICRAFGVPAFLLDLGENTGLSTQFISDSITLFNSRIGKMQSEIMRAFIMMFPESADKFVMTQLDPVKYIDPIILQKLSPDEQRGLIGFKPAENAGNSEVSLAQTIGVGGTTSLISILQDPALSRDQKINALVILFNIPEDKAGKLVGNTVTPTE